MKTNNYLGKQDQNRGIVLFIIVFVICVIVIGILSHKNEKVDNKGISTIDSMAQDIEKQIVDVSKFEVDGTNLNIEGELKENITESTISNLEEVDFVLKSKEGDKYFYPMDYFISTEGIDISMPENTNIDLSTIEKGEYFAFIRIKYETTKTDTGYRYRYYTLRNNTENNNIEVENVKLEFKTSDRVSNYLTINVKKK